MIKKIFSAFHWRIRFLFSRDLFNYITEYKQIDFLKAFGPLGSFTLIFNFFIWKTFLYFSGNRIKNKYFNNNNIRKLHLGCGVHLLDGWLNTDFSPKSSNVLTLDVTKTFPFLDGVFDYVFNEHLIEHLTYVQGYRMLNECYRVLRSGGKIRISTPDLGFLIKIYNNPQIEINKSYINWVTVHEINYAPFCDAVFIINNFMRSYGHQFIYEEKILRFLMEKCGFEKIEKFNLSQSKDSELCGLENIERLPNDFLMLETFTLEGTKL